MPTLGEILGGARRSAPDFERWLSAVDSLFAEQVRQVAERQSCSVAQFARHAVADFDRFAHPDAWTQLMTKIRDDEDPAKTCLMVMVQWHLERNAQHVADA